MMGSRRFARTIALWVCGAGCSGRAESPSGCSNASAELPVAQPCAPAAVEDEPLPIDRPCFGRCEDASSEPRPVPLPRPVCPEEPPDLGTACERPIDLCTYGETNVAACRTFFTCADDVWSVPERFSGLVCPAAPDCPDAFPHGEACDFDAIGASSCEYPGGYSCFCNRSERAWTCWGPPVDERCPELLPNIGEGCHVQALECTYAPFGCDALSTAGVLCFDGAWQERGLICEG